MKAAVYYGPGDVRLEDIPDPAAGPGELVVRVTTVGICGTDAGEYSHAPMFFPINQPHPVTRHLGPTVPGHEFSGVVVGKAEGVEGFSEGDMIASGAGVWCGRCGPCTSGKPNLCERYWTVGLHRHGALAELVAVPAICCLNLSETNISADLAALAQPMSIAVHASRRGRVEASDRVVIIGTGGIGSFLTYATAQSGAIVTAVDLDSARLRVAETLGASHSLQVRAEMPLGDQIVRASGKPSLVFECTATAEGLQAAVEIAGPGGRVVVVGHQPRPLPLEMRLVSFWEKELIGTMAQIFSQDFVPAVELLTRDPRVWTSVAPIVHPLDQLLEAGLIPMTERRSQHIKNLFDPSVDVVRPLIVS